MNNQELSNKIDHEGGIVATLDYGVTFEDISDPQVQELWKEVQELYFSRLRPQLDRIRELLPEPGTERDIEEDDEQ